MDILSAALRYHMFEPDDLVLCAVSGGPDSVAMLHALHTRADEFGISLHIAHMNHGIRGEQSNIDQDFVCNLGQEFGIPVTTKLVDVPSIVRQTGMSEEEASRNQRYKFLQDTCTELGAAKIAIAHSADDRAESVLLNIIRGSGITGLGSIRPVRDIIVRPLIEATRADIMAYIEEYGIPFRIDETNANVKYTRNRVRHELIPLLQQDFSPRIIDALTRLADVALPEDEFLNDIAQSVIRSIRMSHRLDAGLLADQPLSIQRRVIRAEIERIKGDLMDIGLEQVDSIIAALKAGKDFTITLPSGKVFARRCGYEFTIGVFEHIAEAAEFDHILTIPGVNPIPEVGISITAVVEDISSPSKLPSSEIMIPQAAISGRLRIRNIRPGDRIVPFGMNHAKKLQDILVDKKILRRDRADIAIVEDDEKILWVAGIVTSESTRLVEPTKNAIRLVLNKA